MYPYPILLDMTLYEILIVLGFVLCVATYRFHADRKGYPAGLENLTILGGTGGIALGYYAAVLVQAFYNYLDSGVWELSSSTGATFLGGLMGGVITFFAVYLIGSALLYRGKENIALRRIGPNCDIVITCVVIAHAFGRLGCLFAGCCHGAVVEGFPGLWNESVGAYTIPIPLYEALFLLALYAFLSIGLIHGWGHQLSIYLASYGVWRFFIEFFRADDRGQTIVPFLSPSQLMSLVMIGLSILLFLLRERKKSGRSEISTEFPTDSGENHVESGEN